MSLQEKGEGIAGDITAGEGGYSRRYHSRSRFLCRLTVVLLAQVKTRPALVSVLLASQDQADEPDAAAGGRRGQGQAVGDQVGRGDLPHLCVREGSMKLSRQSLGGKVVRGTRNRGRKQFHNNTKCPDTIVVQLSIVLIWIPISGLKF